mgnify:CR=1 FL=1
MKLILFFLLLTTVSAQQCTTQCNEKTELGHSTWHLLHEIVKHADPEYSPAFMNLIKILSVLYPCAECRDHISNYISNRRIEMNEKWLCEFHDSVNIRLNKPIHGC